MSWVIFKKWIFALYFIHNIHTLQVSGNIKGNKTSNFKTNTVFMRHEYVNTLKGDLVGWASNNLVTPFGVWIAFLQYFRQ